MLFHRHCHFQIYFNANVIKEEQFTAELCCLLTGPRETHATHNCITPPPNVFHLFYTLGGIISRHHVFLPSGDCDVPEQFEGCAMGLMMPCRDVPPACAPAVLRPRRSQNTARRDYLSGEDASHLD